MAAALKKLHPPQDLTHSPNPLPLRERIDNILPKRKPSPKTYPERALSQTSNQGRTQLDYYPEEPTNADTSQTQPQHFYLHINDIPKQKASQSKGKGSSLNSSTRSQEVTHLAPKGMSNRPSQNPSKLNSRRNSIEVYQETQRNEADQFNERGSPSRIGGAANDENSPQNYIKAIPQTSRESSHLHAQISDRMLMTSRLTDSPENKYSEPHLHERRIFKPSQVLVQKPEISAKKEHQSFDNNQFIAAIQQNLKFVTNCREHGNQPLTLFNPITKQLACIQCIYQQKDSTRKNNFMSSQHAFSHIAEHTKFFKLEAQEKIFDIDKQLQACGFNIKTRQENLRFSVKSISQEFEALHDELRHREAQLLGMLHSVTENQIDNLRNRKENLQYLRACYQDSKEVDPSTTVEQCVHFYAVFNMLKNAMKALGSQAEQLTPDQLDCVEFAGKKELKGLIEKYGKVRTAAKTQTTGNFLKHSRIPAGNVYLGLKRGVAGAGNQSFERTAPSPVRGSEITPSKKKESSPQPTPSYLERESLRNRFKVQSILENQKTLRVKLQTKAKTARSSPVSARKLQQNQNSSRLNENSEIDRTEDGRLSSRDLLRKQSEPLNIIQEDWNQPEYAYEKLRERTRASSTTDFKTYLNYIEQYKENQVDRDYYREQSRERPNEVKQVNYEQASPKNYETVSFKGSWSLQLFQESKIIIDDEIKHDLISIFSESIQETKLLFRLSEDGPSSEIFHSKCDGKTPILALVYANRHYVFGYYLPVPLEKEDKYEICDDSFLFSLRNPELAGPLVFPIKKDKKFIAVYQSSKSPCLGSTIMNKQDLWIQLDEPNKSCSNIGYAYKLPSGLGGSVALAGQFTDWQVQEIEFYKISFRT